MIKYQHLIGREWHYGKQDCYAIVRDFYKDNFQIDLPNYARPNHFWEYGMDLYFERYHKNGFRPVDCHPTEYQVGDVFLMAINSTVACHAAILVENGRLLHHMLNQLSGLVPYKGLYRNSTVAILRHKDVSIKEHFVTQDLQSILPTQIRLKVDAALRDYQGPRS